MCKPVEQKNHRSANIHHKEVEKELCKQLEQGNYVISSSKPTIVSALAAIPKDDGSVRLIHDASRPYGSAMNDYANLGGKEKFQTIEDACKLAKKNFWCAKVDLQSAYRSVALHPDEYVKTGLKWHFEGQAEPVFLHDIRLPFGATKGPKIFHRLSQAVRRCMARRGFPNVVVYIDDFLVLAPTYKQCQDAMMCLVRLLRSLGFNISWKKLVGPTQKIRFLGVDICTKSSTLSLGADKRAKLKQQLLEFRNRKRASKRQLQQLAGSLNWACQAVRGGRFFLRRILDCIKPLQEERHKLRLSREFKRDLAWWLTYMDVFNGTVYFDTCGVEHVHTDACEIAAGAFYRGDWHYTVFQHDLKAGVNLHINYKEACAVFLAVSRWAPLWRGKTVIVHTDNNTARCITNRGWSRNAYVNKLMRRLFWICAKYDCRLKAVSVSGSINILADTVSRLHEDNNVCELQRLLSNWFHQPVLSLDLHQHMSRKSLQFLCRMVGLSSS